MCLKNMNTKSFRANQINIIAKAPVRYPCATATGHSHGRIERNKFRTSSCSKSARVQVYCRPGCVMQHSPLTLTITDSKVHSNGSDVHQLMSTTNQSHHSHIHRHRHPAPHAPSSLLSSCSLIMSHKALATFRVVSFWGFIYISRLAFELLERESPPGPWLNLSTVLSHSVPFR